MSRRTNPWPALVDLFSALLVAAFAGFILIASELKGSGDLRGEIQALEAALAECMPASITLERENDQLRAANQELRKALDRLRSGEGPPSCVRDADGRIAALYDVTVDSDGIRVEDSADYLLQGLSKSSRKLLRWTTEGPISFDEFAERSTQIYDYSRSDDNFFGAECRFFVDLHLQGLELGAAAQARARVEQFFLLRNQRELLELFVAGE